MKRLNLALAVVLFTAQLAFAQQPPPGPPPRGGPMAGMMVRQLGLDDTQKAQVKRILDEQRTQHEAERKQFEATGQRRTPEEMRAMMRQHEQELTQALSGVLTPDQLAKFKAMQEERREHTRHGPPPPPPAGQ
ncbi:MAG: periplasmic heavy metal sensor [Gammaproteobacteria bacterium]